MGSTGKVQNRTLMLARCCLSAGSSAGALILRRSFSTISLPLIARLSGVDARDGARGRGRHSKNEGRGMGARGMALVVAMEGVFCVPLCCARRAVI